MTTVCSDFSSATKFMGPRQRTAVLTLYFGLSGSSRDKNQSLFCAKESEHGSELPRRGILVGRAVSGWRIDAATSPAMVGFRKNSSSDTRLPSLRLTAATTRTAFNESPPIMKKSSSG